MEHQQQPNRIPLTSLFGWHLQSMVGIPISYWPVRGGQVNRIPPYSSCHVFLQPASSVHGTSSRYVANPDLSNKGTILSVGMKAPNASVWQSSLSADLTSNRHPGDPDIQVIRTWPGKVSQKRIDSNAAFELQSSCRRREPAPSSILG